MKQENMYFTKAMEIIETRRSYDIKTTNKDNK